VNAKQKLVLKRLRLNVLGLVLPNVAAELLLKIFTTPTHFQRPEWEKKLLQTGKSLFFKNGLRGTSWGDSSQPTILLMHGWSGRGAQLGALVEPLTVAGFRVVAVDGPAHGDSAGKRSNVKTFARSLIEVSDELADNLGGVFCIVAHSFGASASVLALHLGLKLQCLVLIAAPSDLRRIVGNFIKLMKMRPGLAVRFQNKLRIWDQLKPEEADLALLGVKYEVPALLIHDPEDHDVDYANSVRMAKLWPKAQLLTLNGVGHRQILRAPATLRAVRDFVVSVRQSSPGTMQT